MLLVSATCPKVYEFELSVALLEPEGTSESSLPPGVIISPAFLTMERGLVHAPVVNVGTSVTYLRPRVALGVLYQDEALGPSEAVIGFREEATP